jgi:hypothetical protein
MPQQVNGALANGASVGKMSGLLTLSKYAPYKVHLTPGRSSISTIALLYKYYDNDNHAKNNDHSGSGKPVQ